VSGKDKEFPIFLGMKFFRFRWFRFKKGSVGKLRRLSHQKIQPRPVPKNKSAIRTFRSQPSKNFGRSFFNQNLTNRVVRPPQKTRFFQKKIWLWPFKKLGSPPPSFSKIFLQKSSGLKNPSVDGELAKPNDPFSFPRQKRPEIPTLEKIDFEKTHFAGRKEEKKQGEKATQRKEKFLIPRAVYRIFFHSMAYSSLFVVFLGIFFSLRIENKGLRFIETTETPPYTASQIENYLQVRTQNFNSLDSMELSQKLSRLSWIQSGEVRKFPPTALKITYLVRKPVAIISDKNRFFLLDEENTLLDLQTKTPPKDLPLLFLPPSFENLQVGKTLGGYFGTQLGQLLSLLKTEKFFPWKNLATIDAKEPYEIKIVTYPFGNAFKVTIENFPKELKTWQEQSKKFQPFLEKIDSLDLRVPNQILFQY